MRDLPEYCIDYRKRMRVKRACRIWKFWKDKIIDDYVFIFYRNAPRLVILTKLSSCAVERVFSHIKLIVDRVGKNKTE